MIDHQLISNIALGDKEFEQKIINHYQIQSKALLHDGSQLLVDKSWTILHLNLRTYRDTVAHLLKKSALNRINAVLEILLSGLNSSAKQMAYLDLSAKIKRGLS